MRPLLTCALLLFPTSAPAQHSFSGLAATSTPWRIEPGTKRAAGPVHEASGMIAERRFERELPAFQYRDQALGIPDRFEAIFYAEKRPIRVAIRVKTTGDTLTVQWKKKLRDLFDYLDRDGDGYLNAFEADFLLSNNALDQFLSGGFAYPTAADSGRSLEDADRDGDRRISFDEFLAYHAGGAQSLVASRLFVRTIGVENQITERLFKLIDLDGDGKLSKNELDQLPSFLSRFDADEDDCLTLTEILPGVYNIFGNPIDPDKPPTNVFSPLEMFLVGKISDRAIERLLLQYDRNKNVRLSREESGFDATTFDRLDRDKDGELSLLELMAWRDGPPDFAIELTLDPKPDQSKAVLIGPAPSKEQFDLRVEGGRAIVTSANQKLTISIRGAASGPRSLPAANEENQLFAEADQGNKGYILEKDLVGPSFQLMRLLFDMMDRDGDGKVTRKEFDDYAKIQKSFAGMPLVLQYGTNTPSLFSVLDQNGDGRLSLRELRDAWTVLSKLEPTGAAFITRSAIQPQGTIDFGKSQLLEGNVSPPTYRVGMSAQPKSGGPIWFRRMDRNGDEELSRSEFLGTKEDFDKIDTDHDDRISLQEAIEADKLMRPAKK